jgi:hypothetical protein
VGFLCLYAGLLPAPAVAQLEVWHIGKGGLSWGSQAESQSGALDIDGALQPLELGAGESLIELLVNSGQPWLNGQPTDFTIPGQPRTWSNDGLFNQIDGPLKLIDGDPGTSSKGTFKSARSQAGAQFYFDLGAAFPIERIRFFPDPEDEDAFIKAFELLVNDGEDFNDINRPNYSLLRRVEVNKEGVVDLEFAPFQGRFLQLKVLSKSSFNLAEFEIYGQGFVPLASYLSELHSFGGAVNYGRVLVHATRLSRGGGEAEAAPFAAVQMRTGADPTPLNYFRRDRDTGAQVEISMGEYTNELPRRALFRKDPLTGALTEVADRSAYQALAVNEQGAVRDFVQGDIRADVGNWSSWSVPLKIDSTGSVQTPVGLPSPREFMQLRVLFDGDADNAIRLDTLQVEFSPGLVSAAVGEIGLASDPGATGVLAVEGGIESSFIYDIRAEFDEASLDGFRGIRVESFPPPIFEKIEMGEPLLEIQDFEIQETAGGFDVLFAPVTQRTNQPVRVTFKLRLVEHNTPVNAWLLGAGAVPPHPVAPGNASEEVGSGVVNVFTRESVPTVETTISTPVITPNGDGANEFASISVILTQFSADVEVDIGIFDLSGKQVRELVSASRSAGAITEVWGGRDQGDDLVPPGIYICRVAVQSDAETFGDVQLIGVTY